MRITRSLVLASALAALVSGFASTAALAQAAAPEGTNSTANAPGGRGYFQQKFDQKTGKEIYEGVCQGCHIAGGKGAVAAGTYPAFVNSKNLASAPYTLITVVAGRKNMPPFGQALDDDQVAEVVNYIRTNFGNHYTDAVTAADVKTYRPAPAPTAPR